MRIVEEYNNVDSGILEVKSAQYLGDFAVRLAFNDGFTRLVDFKPFLEHSLHPAIHRYLNEQLFKQFVIVDGNLNWNDYDLIFPLEDLYKGQL